MRILSLLTICLIITSCSLFQRHPRSGYADFESRYTETPYSPEENLKEEQLEDSITYGLDINAYETRMIRIGFEKKLKNLEEKRQYAQFKALMNEKERIEFLKLSDIYDRDRWLDENGFSTPEKRHSREVAALIEKNDIALGMNRLAVKDSWGDPDLVEIAGSPANGSERWQFIESIGTTEGFKVQERYVYFEKGKVVGWQTKK